MERKGIHFMAVLGTSPYTDCVYEATDAGFSYQTPFVQLAVLNYKMPEYIEGDRITVFVTEKAEKVNWLNRDYEENDLKKLRERGIQPALGEKRIGLKELLETAYPHTPIERRWIPEGRNKAELDQIFEIIDGAIETKETILFDFTHGLRNIPMQALTILNYAKALKEIEMGGIFYGAFELGVTGEDGMLHVELQDMSSCSTILDWTSAAEAFVKGGSSNQIRELYEKGDGEGTLDSLYDLTNCLETSRGKTGGCSEKQSIRKAYEKFQDSYEKLCLAGQSALEAPLKRLLDRIWKDVKIFTGKLYLTKAGKRLRLDNTATGMAAVQWAINKGLTQQGFTALEETIKTYVCEMHRLPVGNRNVREDVVKKTLMYVSHKHRKLPEWTTEQICEGRLEELEKDMGRFTERQKDDYRQAVERMIKERPKSLFELSYTVSALRNGLNHFGFQPVPEEYKTLQEALAGQYQRLREIMRDEEQVEWAERE